MTSETQTDMAVPPGLDHVRAVLAAEEAVTLPPEIIAEMRDMPPADDGWAGRDEPPPPAPPEDEPPPEQVCAAFALNDHGNALRVRTHWGQDILFVAQVGWFVWDGRRWARDEEISRDAAPRVRRLVHGLGERIAREVPHLSATPRVKGLLAQERHLRRVRDDLEALDVRSEDQQTQLRSTVAELVQVETKLKDHKTVVSQRLTFAKNAGNSNAMNNALNEVRVLLSHEVAQMDVGVLDLNTESGLLRFAVEMRDAGDAQPRLIPSASVAMVPHARDQLLTKLMPVTYDPAATCPRFDAFLSRIQPDREMRLFLQRWFGLSLTALPVQKLAFFHGAGANGKSVLVDLISRIAGDYGATARIESLTGSNRKSGADATPDLIPLIGARMVRASEPEEGQKLQEGLIKALTGGEKILVRALHADFIELSPYFKLTISGNHKPDIRGTDDGIWRRVMLVPFDVQIPKAEQIPKDQMDAQLWSERSGILNWLIAGLIDFLERGLREPESVLDATAAFRKDSDPVGTFLTDATVVTGGDEFMTARELIEAFNFWVEERGETAWGKRTVSMRLKDKAEKWRHPATGRMFAPGKSGVTGYRGIRLDDAFAMRQREAEADAEKSRWTKL